MQVPSAHRLFISFLNLIGFDRHTMMAWLVNPETDALEYLLHYAKRLGASARRDITEEERQLWRPPPVWLVREKNKLVKFLRESQRSLFVLGEEGALPFRHDPMISNIQNALEVITNFY